MTETVEKTIVIPVDGGDENASAETETPQGQDDQLQLLTDQLQRLQAEFSNYKRRTEKEWAGVLARAKGDMALKLLPVLDDFERLLDHHAEDVQVDREGVHLIVQKMIKAMTEEGLEVVAAVGQAFDPELHQAIALEDVDADQDEMVIEQWQKGYRLGGRLLRPSQVKVGRHQTT